MPCSGTTPSSWVSMCPQAEPPLHPPAGGWRLTCLRLLPTTTTYPHPLTRAGFTPQSQFAKTPAACLMRFVRLAPLLPAAVCMCASIYIRQSLGHPRSSLLGCPKPIKTDVGATEAAITMLVIAFWKTSRDATGEYLWQLVPTRDLCTTQTRPNENAHFGQELSTSIVRMSETCTFKVDVLASMHSTVCTVCMRSMECYYGIHVCTHILPTAAT